MYAGTTVGKNSGNIIGVHQRIDRIARRNIQSLVAEQPLFPSIKQILHFEGNNGPDGVKRKSPSIDEPWHFIDPNKDDDRSVLEMIADHQYNLAVALKAHNTERAAFECAWMAHAITDGLTPAHHFPLADKIEELFGMPHHLRSSVKEKNIITGTNRRDTFAKNWQYWGKGGIFMNHFMFEFGVATAIIGDSYERVSVSKNDITELKLLGYEAVFKKILQQVVALGTYDTYTEHGWNRSLARTIKHSLLPLIVKAVMLGWYQSVVMQDTV